MVASELRILRWITFAFGQSKENASTIHHEVSAALSGEAATMFRFLRLGLVPIFLNIH